MRGQKLHDTDGGHRDGLSSLPCSQGPRKCTAPRPFRVLDREQGRRPVRIGKQHLQQPGGRPVGPRRAGAGRVRRSPRAVRSRPGRGCLGTDPADALQGWTGNVSAPARNEPLPQRQPPHVRPLDGGRAVGLYRYRLEHLPAFLSLLRRGRDRLAGGAAPGVRDEPAAGPRDRPPLPGGAASRRARLRLSHQYVLCPIPERSPALLLSADLLGVGGGKPGRHGGRAERRAGSGRCGHAPRRAARG